jgi:hypothetical protein
LKRPPRCFVSPQSCLSLSLSLSLCVRAAIHISNASPAIMVKTSGEEHHLLFDILFSLVFSLRIVSLESRGLIPLRYFCQAWVSFWVNLSMNYHVKAVAEMCFVDQKVNISLWDSLVSPFARNSSRERYKCFCNFCNNVCINRVPSLMNQKPTKRKTNLCFANN